MSLYLYLYINIHVHTYKEIEKVDSPGSPSLPGRSSSCRSWVQNQILSFTGSSYTFLRVIVIGNRFPFKLMWLYGYVFFILLNGKLFWQPILHLDLYVTYVTNTLIFHLTIDTSSVYTWMVYWISKVRSKKRFCLFTNTSVFLNKCFQAPSK